MALSAEEEEIFKNLQENFSKKDRLKASVKTFLIPLPVLAVFPFLGMFLIVLGVAINFLPLSFISFVAVVASVYTLYNRLEERIALKLRKLYNSAFKG